MERHYYIYDIPGESILYYKKEASFFSKKDYRSLGCLYFYKENGKFYEFFTGRYLGSDKDIEELNTICHHHVLRIEKTTFEIRFTGTWTESVATAIPAETFAEYIKKLIDDKELIISGVQNFFNEKHQKWVELNEQKNSKPEKTEQDLENIKWLNSILDSRNNE